MTSDKSREESSSTVHPARDGSSLYDIHVSLRLQSEDFRDLRLESAKRLTENWPQILQG